MKSILDPTFRYVKSADTDIRKTFARIRREQAKARLDSEQLAKEHPVLPLGQRKARS